MQLIFLLPHIFPARVKIPDKNDFFSLMFICLMMSFSFGKITILMTSILLTSYKLGFACFFLLHLAINRNCPVGAAHNIILWYLALQDFQKTFKNLICDKI